MKKKFVFTVFLTAIALSLFSLTAFGSSLTCTNINNMASPITITNPGSYCLTANLTTSSTSTVGIIVASDNVTIDLMGWTLQAGNPAPWDGIMVYPQSNVTIRNGKINGFSRGVILNNGGTGVWGNNVVEGMQIDCLEGIGAYGYNNVIKNNRILLPSPGIGIYARYSTIIDNDLYNADIDVSGTGSGLVIENNRIGYPLPVQGGTSGIYIMSGSGGETNVLVVNNRIRNADTGILFDVSTSGLYRDNLTSGCTTSYNIISTNVINAGNNW